MIDMSADRLHLHERGFVVSAPLFDAAECSQLASALSRLPQGQAGSRNMLTEPWCIRLAHRLRTHPQIAPLLPLSSVAVQCTLFEKSRERNWLVGMHQDLSIPVRERVEHPALSGWSEKEGGLFVQPPDDVLDALVAVRLHIDRCGEKDGALRIVPGSHRHGRLRGDAAARLRDASGETTCPVERGAAMAMKPLLLHASAKTVGSGERRVLHVVFGPPSLPCGLHWRHAV